MSLSYCRRWKRLPIEDKIAVVAVAQWPVTVLVGMILTWTGIVR